MAQLLPSASDPYVIALAAVGAVSLVGAAYRVIRFLYHYNLPFFYCCGRDSVFQKRGHDLLHRYRAAGNWAVVTGGSEGIGLGFAKDLARRGFNILLMARTQSKMDEAAAEIRELYPNISVETIQFNFGSADAAAWASVAETLSATSTTAKGSRYRIGLLVNNVGINYQFPAPFDERPVEEDLAMLRVNCESTLRMTKIVLPHMKAAGCGGIVCLGSVSSLHPTPLGCTYSGTKAFCTSFAKSLASEGLFGPSMLHPHTTTPTTKGRGEGHHAPASISGCQYVIADDGDGFSSSSSATTTSGSIGSGGSGGFDVLVPSPSLVSTPPAREWWRLYKPEAPTPSPFLCADPDELARASLNCLGVRPTTIGHPNHAILDAIMSLLPTATANREIAKPQYEVYRRSLSLSSPPPIASAAEEEEEEEEGTRRLAL